MFLFRVAFGLIRLMFRFSLALALLAAIALVVYTTFWLPDVTPLVSANPETTSFMESARERNRKEASRVVIRQEWVPLDDVSKHLVNAVLVGEDDRFYQHQGFDFTEIQNAIEENIDAGRYVRGGSTLSQQLAKNLYLSPNKTLRRKFDEMLLTWKLEHTLDKNRILEIYLNVIEWGGGTFGAEAASQYYFSKPASMLSEKEAAALAARIPNPDGMSVQKRDQREAMILARMERKGTADRREEVRLAQTPPAAQPSPSSLPKSVDSREWMETATKVTSSVRGRLQSILQKLDLFQTDEIAVTDTYKPLPAPTKSVQQSTVPPAVKPESVAKQSSPTPVTSQPPRVPSSGSETALVPPSTRTVVSGPEVPAAVATPLPAPQPPVTESEGWTLSKLDLPAIEAEDGNRVPQTSQELPNVVPAQQNPPIPVAPARAERKPARSDRLREALLRFEKAIDN